MVSAAILRAQSIPIVSFFLVLRPPPPLFVAACGLHLREGVALLCSILPQLGRMRMVAYHAETDAIQGPQMILCVHVSVSGRPLRPSDYSWKVIVVVTEAKAESVHGLFVFLAGCPGIEIERPSQVFVSASPIVPNRQIVHGSGVPPLSSRFVAFLRSLPVLGDAFAPLVEAPHAIQRALISLIYRCGEERDADTPIHLTAEAIHTTYC
mmetsp:Transcript_35289/g.49437  ORF Transcript_35289/g.49437 Transcript_35289/m.49437 type:complete len:209 (+) Transcript_35289:512-1138(+)